MMPLRISRLRCGLTPRRFGGTALSIDANCSSLSQNRSAIVLLHVNRGVESGLLESGQALETWELSFEPSPVRPASPCRSIRTRTFALLDNPAERLDIRSYRGYCF